MKQREVTTLLLLLMTSSLILGQNGPDQHLKKTVLFEITHQDSENKSYLFGTHHAFGKLFFDSLTIAKEALSSSDILIKENLNIPGRTAEELINRRKKTTAWNTYLNPKDLIFLKALFSKSPTDLNKMTPPEMYVFLNRHFKQQVCLNNKANSKYLSLDDYIGFKANEQNMALYGLETIEEQIELINKDVAGMPRRVHKRRLSNIIEKIRTENTNDCGETDWYSKMEIDYQLDKPCGNELILTDRNLKWIKTIKELLNSKRCFIAVGLSHLMYECGLINQLQGLGFKITPINLTPK